MHFGGFGGTSGVFYFIPQKKQKLARFVQFTSLRNRMHVESDLFFFHVEPWAENNNLQHRHTPFAISKVNFSEVFYNSKNRPRIR